MIKFVTSNEKVANVEEIMECVNRYVLFSDETEVYDCYNDIKKEKCGMIDAEKLNFINTHYQLVTYHPFETKGLISKIKAFLKKVIRKTIYWYVQELAEQQNMINGYEVQILNEVADTFYQIKKENKELRKEIMELKKKQIEDEGKEELKC